MGQVPQDFAMFEPNNTYVLTIQLHFDSFKLIQLFKNRTNLPQLTSLRISTNKKQTKKYRTKNSRTIGLFYFLRCGNLTNTLF